MSSSASPPLSPPPSPSLAQSMDGRPAAAALLAAVDSRARRVEARRGHPPGLAVVQVGDHAPSSIYVRHKLRRAAALGLVSRVLRLPTTISLSDLLAQVVALNNDAAIDALLVQLPLPPHLPAGQVMAAIAPAKDADGLHPANIGQLVAGAPSLQPCTPAGIMALLAHYDVPLLGAHAVVVGRSAIVGRPLAALMLRAHATVTHCHRHTRDLAAHVGRGDVVVVAVGQPELVQGDWLKPGCVVVDVGLTRQASRLVGDVHAPSAQARARLLSPVPGGVGPMTVAMLMHNTVLAAERACGLV